MGTLNSMGDDSVGVLIRKTDGDLNPTDPVQALFNASSLASYGVE